MSIISEIESTQKKAETVPFRPGDQVKVHFKVVEGDNERVQLFKGIVHPQQGVGHK